MTIKEYQKKLDKRLSEISLSNTEIKECLNDAHADYVRRIFVNGRNGNLQKIGQYSTKTMLAGKSAFEGLRVGAFKQTKIKSTSVIYSSNIKTRKVSAKKGETIERDLWLALPNKKTGKKNKALPIMVIEGGYKKYRQLVGRKSDFVNLNLRGRLFTELANKGRLHFTKSKATSMVTGENAKKVEGAIDKYGKTVFELDAIIKRNLTSCLAKLSVKIITK